MSWAWPCGPSVTGPRTCAPRSRRSPSTGPTIAASGPLSQLGGTWPSDGRKIGIVVDPEADNTDLLDLHEAIVAASMTPLVIAPRGGEVAGVPVGRTLATAASVELDALLLAGNALLAPDSRPSVDAKAGAPGDGTVEPRVGKLIDECWRHSKVIGAWGPGRETLKAHTAAGGAGLVVGDDGRAVLGEITPLLAAHRVWERFPAGA